MLIRCQFGKGDRVRFISHLDLMRTMERAARRAGLPLTYTQGYHPRPKVSYGPPLPLGTTSEAEFADWELTDLDPQEFIDRLNGQLPAGLGIVQARQLVPPVKSLMAIIDVASYAVTIPDAGDRQSWQQLQEKAAGLMEQEVVEVVRHKKGKKRTVDIRPLIKNLDVSAHSNGTVINIVNRTGSKGNVRPQEILSLLAIDEGKARIHRNGLFVTKRGKLVSPLEVGNE